MSRVWVVACLLALTAPFVSVSQGAPDPVEELRRVLATPKNLEDKRDAKIDAAIGRLHTIPQMRRAYMLSGWRPATSDAEKEKQDPGQLKIEKKLIGAIESAMGQANADADDAARKVKLLAVAMLLAELADSEPPTERKRDKLARKLAGVAIELSKNSNIAVKQTALHALGKMTPPPAVALKILQARVLDRAEPGPRRVAAYALIDLVKNGSSLSRPEQIQTIHGVINTATLGFGDASAEEALRGYCLLAIRDAAKSLDDWIASAELENEAVLRELQTALAACEAANPALIDALHNAQTNIRVASMDALIAFAQARVRVLPRIAVKKGLTDPLGGPTVFDARVKGVAAVLINKDNDVRLRRGGLVFLDLLRAQAKPALPEITQAMNDTDGLVRYAAARAIRHLPLNADQKTSSMEDRMIETLGRLLLDGDPDVNSAAAESLEVLGPHAGVAIESLSKAITFGDVENRVAALKLVGNLGTATGVRAYPAVIESLGYEDSRVTRQAAETLGQFGAIAQQEAVKAKTDPELKRLFDSLRAAALPALATALRDQDAETRLNASEAILSIGTGWGK